MGAVQLPRAVAEPDHVARKRPPALARLVEAGQRLLVIEEQRLMAGEQADRPGRLVAADRAVDLWQVGIGRGRIGLEEIDRDLRLAVGVEQAARIGRPARHVRSEEHTSELQSLMRSSYAVFCLKKKN